MFLLIPEMADFLGLLLLKEAKQGTLLTKVAPTKISHYFPFAIPALNAAIPNPANIPNSFKNVSPSMTPKANKIENRTTNPEQI